jgi:type I restriction enzyme S subunit
MNSEWYYCKLGNFGEVVTGSTPSTKNLSYWNGDIPFYSPADFSSNRYCSVTERTITKKGLRSGREIKANSVMFTCIGSIGKIAINKNSGITNQQINTIAVDENKFEFQFIYYLLLKNKNRFVNYAPMTTIQIVNKSEFEKFEFLIPYKQIQTKIAKILTTIDNVIEKTEEAIAKYEAIKQGMMHDLFARGIGADGQLRPSFQNAPELYKESELGWIPKGWECEQLDKYITFKMYGPRFSAKDYNKYGNVKTIRGMDFTKDGKIIYDQSPIALLPNVLVRTHQLETDDVIIVTTADCGLTAVFEDQGFPYIPSAYTVKYKINDKINPYFFKFQMETHLAKVQVDKYIRKGTLANLPGSDLLKFWMKIPLKDEQEKIIEKLKKVISKVEVEKQVLAKQTQLKKGLMQDLLTGKVPVKI